VWVDPKSMRKYNIAVTDVVNGLNKENIELPGGDFSIKDKNFKDIKTTENNIAEQFTKYHKDKVAARKILGQFIDQIAA